MKGHSFVQKNTAVNGGGVYFASLNSTGKFIMQDFSKVKENTANTSGGGVYVESFSGKFIMHEILHTGDTVDPDIDYEIASNKAEIEGNTATTGNGGGVYFYSSAAACKFTMNAASCIHNNKAKGSGNGGGVYMVANTTFEMTDTSEISNNEAGSGGGVYMTTGNGYTPMLAGTVNFTMNKETSSTGKPVIKDNTATTGNGGGVYVNSFVAAAVSSSDPGTTTPSTGTITMKGGTINGGVYLISEIDVKATGGQHISGYPDTGYTNPAYPRSDTYRYARYTGECKSELKFDIGSTASDVDTIHGKYSIVVNADNTWNTSTNTGWCRSIFTGIITGGVQSNWGSGTQSGTDSATF
jgi:hypothetical protein